MKRILPVFLLLLTPLLFAQNLTLNDAIQKTLANNPDYKALKLNLKASEYGVKAAKKVKYGELDLNAGYRKTSDEDIIRPMSKDLMLAGITNMPFDNEYWYWGLDYKLPIYTGGKIMAGEKIAVEKKNSTYYKLKYLEWNLRYKTTKVFLSIISVDKQLDSLNAYLKSLESLKTHIEEGYKLGKFAEVDVYKVNFQIEDAKYKIETLNQIKESLLNALANLMGDEKVKDYNLVGDVKGEPELNLPDLNKLISIAFENRSDYKATKSFANIKKLNLKITKADWMPKVSIDANLMSVNGDNIDFNDKFWTVTANVSFPLFDMGKRYHKIKQAKKEQESALNLVESKKLNVRKEVVDAYTKVKKEYQNYKTALASLKFQKEVERIEQLKYDNGRGDIDDLLFAKARKQLADANVIKAKYDYFIAMEELKKSIEGELK
ncbi:RND family efflux pump outer membrane protein [Thermotomaculum hydrothermale]|uniref:RND family efflux pump outer membrane protein n=1 Tax=Thermotomaculum hydrothermale TaxID=981385 RepID=A0A7R6PTY0_9BACT|nr:TolC family protein [Thermotomaculum hydrothermale]BBB32607.1 RND family efflux pump outer membrane protein [Thermotomaculum hydrothermale]